MASRTAENSLRERFLEIERELSSIDPKEDTARRKDVMTRLYLLLISRESIRYFYPIFQKSGAEKAFQEGKTRTDRPWLKPFSLPKNPASPRNLPRHCTNP